MASSNRGPSADGFSAFAEARASFEADKPMLQRLGVSWEPGAEPKAYLPAEFKSNYALALDAIPALYTDPSSAIPWILNTMIDPEIYPIIFAPNKAAQIIGEVKKGTWVDETAMFPTVEHLGEVTSYGDWAMSGHTGVNVVFPQRQMYRYQTIKEYGELELERAGLAKINWVSEIDKASATIMNKFENLTYFFGVATLQNEGLLNDPNLSPAMTPSNKTDTGGTVWINTTTGVIAAPTEIIVDIQMMVQQLINQTAGTVQITDPMCLAMSPASTVALTAVNQYNVNVFDLLKKDFPGLRLESAMQYGKLSPTNPQGIAAGNMVQLIAETIEGRKPAYAAFSEKMRAHPVIRELSAFKQKMSGGTWGTVIRMPMAFVQMVGV